MSPLWGWGIALLATAALHLGAMGYRLGWAVGLLGQGVQLCYALISHQPGFLPVIAATTWGYLVQWRGHGQHPPARALPGWVWPLALFSVALLLGLGMGHPRTLSWGIGFYGASALTLGRVYPSAWGLGALGQALWLAYGLESGEWGFVAFALGVGSGYLRNWIRRKRYAQTSYAGANAL